MPKAQTSAEGATPTIVGRTDVGLVRTHNEDQFLVAQLERALVLEQSGFPITPGERRLDQSGRLLMVADGMGGHEAGELASNLVVDAMAHYAFAVMPWLGTQAKTDEAVVAAGLRGAAEAAQQRLREVAVRKGLSTELGTTLTMAYIRWPECLLVHVGDSRAYLLRSGELFRLTKDHNLAQAMIQRGAMTEEEARRSRWSSVLTNALGGTSDDLHVELHHFELLAGDRLLLCTDGLYGEVGDADIAIALAACLRADLTAECVEHLLGQAKQAGGQDNVTAILAVF
jgi:protein phosphatase